MPNSLQNELANLIVTITENIRTVIYLSYLIKYIYLSKLWLNIGHLWWNKYKLSIRKRLWKNILSNRDI